MADLLATAADLRSLLKEDAVGLPDTDAVILLQLATGAVQGAVGQDLVLRLDDAVVLMGTHDQWFDLPQRPVTAVASVAVDGVAVTDYKLFGDRLWRSLGWAVYPCEPSTVAVTYSHGYVPDAPRLQAARSATLALAAQMFANPLGASALSIDDYSQQFSRSGDDLAGLVPENLRRSLRRAYGPRGRLTRIG